MSKTIMSLNLRDTLISGAYKSLLRKFVLCKTLNDYNEQMKGRERFEIDGKNRRQ